MRTTFRLDKQLHQQLKIYAAKNNMTLFEIMNTALKEYLERNDKNDQDLRK